MILASRSPQRRAILAQLGLVFEVVEPVVEELSSGDPSAVVTENALRKARVVATGSAYAAATVIGADTEVVLDGRVLGKPANGAEAHAYLTALSGARHEVHGGLAVVHSGDERTAHAMTAVTFRVLDEAEIARYVATGEWRERAGGYAIQGRGAMLVASVDGDYLNVVGLPVAALVECAPELFV